MEEMLEKISKTYCKKNKIRSKDREKCLEQKLSAFLQAYATSDDPYEKKVLYILLKFNCEERNVQIDDVLRRFYLHHLKDSKLVFMKDLIALASFGILPGAITWAAM
ncbi:hypothetical protein C922_05043 [Plasmodium inui San Antonio 1]|uniref:Uncharacterized protein n=1 Tax=Plasmodium inui San Antonio 1 TaxID=1237626 RepID=W6ZUZ0_9APIC|nr:hypothetical protein C922_05043 [Plasmodium inui San Antonio 1]EUD64572.1 hypothetical protein C922_05043 [Plasmodium inui San Antonio 1]